MLLIQLTVILLSLSGAFLCDSYKYIGQTTEKNHWITKDMSSNQYEDLENHPTHDQSLLNITDLVKNHQYEIEEHTVTTDDGYILTMHRMQAKTLVQNNITIFLMHGILDSSDSWVLQGPDNALAHILVDKGFDVWVGNARGNKYSSSHITLDKRSSEFWKFSWEEIGVYDLPAMIDYTLNTTGKDYLYYVGYSQGTTSFYVMMSLKPEYNAKVKMMFSLAPIAWISHARSPIMKLFTPAYGILGYITSSLNTYSSGTDFLNKIAKMFCNFLPIGCYNIMQLIIGNDNKFISPSLLSVIYEHGPSGSSTLQFVHYGQLFQSGRFRRFDYGECDNLDKYGQELPPDYDLSNIAVPIVLFYSNNDWLSDVADVAQLFSMLPNVHDSYNIDHFNHFDYMYANTAKDLIYSKIIQSIQECELNNDEN